MSPLALNRFDKDKSAKILVMGAGQADPAPDDRKSGRYLLLSETIPVAFR
jgi:hypothetical protein